MISQLKHVIYEESNCDTQYMYVHCIASAKGRPLAWVTNRQGLSSYSIKHILVLILFHII